MALQRQDFNETRSLATDYGQMAASFLTHIQEKPVVDARPVTSAELEADIREAENFPEGFFAFARHWRFKNREGSAELTFQRMWPGQEAFAELMLDVANEAIRGQTWEGIFALKSGKLGFTELECCWDGYVLWARRNSRVHLFSKEELAAVEMLGYVRYGLKSLEPAWGVRFLTSALRETNPDQAGVKAFRITRLLGDGSQDYGDVRNVVAFATTKFPAINDSCQHAHVDEWCHMQNPGQVWGSISTIIAPGGTAHIVSRGAGEKEEVENVWKAALNGQSKLRAFFQDWTKRPDRDEKWYADQAGSSPTQAALRHFAPVTWEDAFIGDEDQDFVAIEVWDNCFDQYLVDHPLLPGDPTPVVFAADAATSRDIFGILGLTRHPLYPDEAAAIRLTKAWAPEDFEDGEIDHSTIEGWLRAACEGGCALGHPQYEPWINGKQSARLVGQLWDPGACPACADIASGRGQVVPPFNVFQIAYDRHQLDKMMQDLRRDGVAWCKEFGQGQDRLVADRSLLTSIVGRKIRHMGQPKLREHVQNAGAQTQKDQDSKLRIVKKAPHRRIDLCVCASMGNHEIMRLNV